MAFLEDNYQSYLRLQWIVHKIDRTKIKILNSLHVCIFEESKAGAMQKVFIRTKEITQEMLLLICVLFLFNTFNLYKHTFTI